MVGKPRQLPNYSFNCYKLQKNSVLANICGKIELELKQLLTRDKENNRAGDTALLAFKASQRKGKIA